MACTYLNTVNVSTSLATNLATAAILCLVLGTRMDLVYGKSPDGDYNSSEHHFTVETIVKRPGVVWGFDFLPDGSLIFTERAGTLRVYNPESKQTTLIGGLPEIYAQGQGGLLDVAAHPDYQKNSWVYITYAKPTKDGKPTTALARLKFATTGNTKDGGKVKDKVIAMEELFVAKANSSESRHFGSRVVFDGKGHLYLSVGDRGQRDEAQNLQSHQGKILRLHENGKVPSDNPFVKRQDALPEIWTYGHRNPQGLFFDHSNNQLWEVEMGPKGGDELNKIRKAANYGWPVITYGREYYGPKIGEGTSKKGMEQPVSYWVPSISPSGMTVYKGSAFPKWRGDLFLANLSGQHLRRLQIKNGMVVEQETLLGTSYERFRQVRNGPDGFLYFSTDSGLIGRIVPTKRTTR